METADWELREAGPDGAADGAAAESATEGATR
jgi:hypothetical protein